ncbi:hypothetical protein R6Q59_009814 [Mikania micrantha]
MQVGDFDLPIAKRQKLHQTTNTRPTSSRLFAPFRTVGLVSPTNVPFTSVPLGTATFQITTSVGRSLQTYDLRRGLNLVFLSRPQCPTTIIATCAYRDRVFVSWGGEREGSARGIWVYKRGKVIAELECEDSPVQKLEQLLVFGPWIVGYGPKAIEVWKNETYEHYTTIVCPATTGTNEFSGGICTLPTFLNKIFVGNKNGSVSIFNVSTGKLVHTLQPPTIEAGGVTAITPAPAIGLLAIAYSHGSLIIHDVQADEVVIQFRQTDITQPITSITFRSDGAGAGGEGQQDGVMATASIHSGDITLWDLNQGGKVVGILRSAHEITSSQTSGITKIEFLSGQPVIVSSGLDNSLRSWIFDQTPFSPIPRLLHSRSGHASSVTTLRFLPAASDGSEAAGKWLLSAGNDRSLWGFSLRKDGQSSEFSQGNVKSKAKKIADASTIETLKAPPIIAIACSLNRDGGMGAVGGPVWTNPKTSNAEEANMTGWESVVTAHQDDSVARTWFWGRKKAGRWTFETGDRKPAMSVAVTACGTFALVGSAGGSLDMYNLQSGIHRQRFPPKLKPAQAKQLKTQDGMVFPRGHTDAITGVLVDNLNQTVVSTSLDGTAVFWNFTTGAIIRKMRFDSGLPIATRYNSVSGLVSVACDDSCIRVIDVDTQRTVRELWGCVGKIYDHCFSHDGRWIVASSMDSVIRIFDLATGHLIDAFRTATCTNVAFSSTGEFLATAHAGSIGINIWNNKSLFMNIPSRQIDEDRGIIDLVDTIEFESASQLVIQDEAEEEEAIGLDSQTTIEQLDQNLLTLSLAPPLKWQTLLNLDVIRDRNKPIQPPEKPKAAPFFLGSTITNGTTTSEQESDTAVKASVSENEKSRVSRLTSLAASPSVMSNLLSNFSSNTDVKPIISYLTNLSPSAADLEIRSLTITEMTPFIRSLTTRLKQRRDFELVNTWMSVFLKLHSEFVTEVDDIREAVLEFKDVMSQEEARLSRLVGWNRGVVEFLRSSR